jgi:hypothetical protein
MSGDGRYDGELQMFVAEPRDAKRAHLLFLRWLLEHDKIERPISDEPVADGSTETLKTLIERPAPNRACVPRWFGR